MLQILDKFINSDRFTLLLFSVVFIFIFRNQIGEKISELVIKWKTKKGGVQSAGQSKLDSGSAKKLTRQVKILLNNVGINNVEDLSAYLAALQASNQTNSSMVANQQEIIQQLVNLGLYYKNLFLDRFLAPHSKLALLWIYNRSPISRQAFTTEFNDLPNEIVNLEIEKAAIFDALLQNSLLELNGDRYVVSTDGRSFLTSQGLLQ